ncbi:MAG: hypothetical protein QM656_15825 [Paracoccaceae bacterium]
MDPMLDIPKDRKPLKAGRLCLLLGLVALLFLLLAHGRANAGAFAAMMPRF